jgi:hypothetical protein
VTFTAVGSLIQQTATSFSLTPHAVGDLILLEIIQITNATVTVTGVSSSNVTWVQMGSGATYSQGANVGTAALFAGKVTSTSAATVTISWSGTTPATIFADGQEFSSTVGSWLLDVQGNLNSASGTSTWPSLTPRAAKELYFGFGFDTGTAVAGSTTGFTYDVDSHGNGVAFNPACAVSAQAPVWGDSGFTFGIMVLVREPGIVSRSLVVSQAVNRASTY